MAIRYESGSSYFPGYTTAESVIEFLEPGEIAERALKNRREIELLKIDSVNKMACLLAEKTQKPDYWIRHAVTTIDRFSREVCDGGLDRALKAGLSDPLTAEFLLQKYISLHQDLTSVHLSSLLIGPRLWWTVNGVSVSWKLTASAKAKTHIANSSLGKFDPLVRLFMLSLVGTGFTYDQLKDLKVSDFGYINFNGDVVHDLASSPMAVGYKLGAEEKFAFLGEEARDALIKSVIDRNLKPSDFVFGSEDEYGKIRKIAEKRSESVIESVNNVNVTLCKTVGDFFLEWGVPGRNFFKENNLPNPYEE